MFIEDHREYLGVEAICKVLPIAPSTYYHYKSIEADPAKASDRAKRDAFIMTRIDHFWEKSGKRYGAVKIWHDLLDDGLVIARCTVVRLMKSMGIQGITRGDVKTTKNNPAVPCPEDKVNRAFKAPAPNILWVADFTYVRTAVGFVYVNRPVFTGELLFQMLGRFLSGIQGFIEVHLCFFWRDVSDFAV